MLEPIQQHPIPGYITMGALALHYYGIMPSGLMVITIMVTTGGQDTIQEASVPFRIQVIMDLKVQLHAVDLEGADIV